MSQLRSIYKRGDDDNVQVMPDWRETMDREMLIPVSEREQPAKQPPKRSINDFSTEIKDRWRDQVKPEEIYNDADPLHFANLSNTIFPHMHKNPKVIFGDVHAAEWNISNESGKIIDDERWGIEDADDLDLNAAAGNLFFRFFKFCASSAIIQSVETLIEPFDKGITARVLRLTRLSWYPVDNISFTSALILQTKYNISKYEEYEKYRLEEHERYEKSRLEDREENPDRSKKKLKLNFYATYCCSIVYNPAHLQTLHVILNALNVLLEGYLRSDNEQEDLRAATSRFACYLLEIFQKFEVLATNDPSRLANLAILAWGQKRTMLNFETPDRHALTEAVLREVEVIIQHYSINEAVARQNRQDWMKPIFVPGRAVEDKFLQYTQKNLNTWLYIHATLRALYSSSSVGNRPPRLYY